MAIGRLRGASLFRELGRVATASVALAGTFVHLARPWNMEIPAWATTARRARVNFGRRPSEPPGGPDPLLDQVTPNHIRVIAERGLLFVQLQRDMARDRGSKIRQLPFNLLEGIQHSCVMIDADAYIHWVRLMASEDLVSFRTRAILFIFATGRIRPRDLTAMCRLLLTQLTSKRFGRGLNFTASQGDFESHVAELYLGARDYLMARRDIILHGDNKDSLEVATLQLRSVPAEQLHEGLVAFGTVFKDWVAIRLIDSLQPHQPAAARMEGCVDVDDMESSAFFAAEDIPIPIRMAAAEILTHLSASTDPEARARSSRLLAEMRGVAAGIQSGAAGYLRSVQFGQELLELVATLDPAGKFRTHLLLPVWCRPGHVVVPLQAEAGHFLGTDLDQIEQSHGLIIVENPANVAGQGTMGLLKAMAHADFVLSTARAVPLQEGRLLALHARSIASRPDLMAGIRIRMSTSDVALPDWVTPEQTAGLRSWAARDVVVDETTISGLAQDLERFTAVTTTRKIPVLLAATTPFQDGVDLQGQAGSVTVWTPWAYRDRVAARLQRFGIPDERVRTFEEILSDGQLLHAVMMESFKQFLWLVGVARGIGQARSTIVTRLAKRQPVIPAQISYDVLFGAGGEAVVRALRYHVDRWRRGNKAQPNEAGVQRFVEAICRYTETVELRRRILDAASAISDKDPEHSPHLSFIDSFNTTAPDTVMILERFFRDIGVATVPPPLLKVGARSADPRDTHLLAVLSSDRLLEPADAFRESVLAHHPGDVPPFPLRMPRWVTEGLGLDGLKHQPMTSLVWKIGREPEFFDRAIAGLQRLCLKEETGNLMTVLARRYINVEAFIPELLLLGGLVSEQMVTEEAMAENIALAVRWHDEIILRVPRFEAPTIVSKMISSRVAKLIEREGTFPFVWELEVARRISLRPGILHLQMIPEAAQRRTPDGVFADAAGITAYDAKTLVMTRGSRSETSDYARIRRAIEDGAEQIRMQVGWEGKGEVHLAVHAPHRDADRVQRALAAAHRSAIPAFKGISEITYLTAYDPDGSIFLETSSAQALPSGSS